MDLLQPFGIHDGSKEKPLSCRGLRRKNAVRAKSHVRRGEHSILGIVKCDLESFGRNHGHRPGACIRPMTSTNLTNKSPFSNKKTSLVVLASSFGIALPCIFRRCLQWSAIAIINEKHLKDARKL
ncbi:hypothetical protein C6366_12990 [Desulfonatronum sp. SC1]|nr:hypothetical protein C6366_12990 [Desulfonatronum sp. SC1]